MSKQGKQRVLGITISAVICIVLVVTALCLKPLLEAFIAPPVIHANNNTVSNTAGSTETQNVPSGVPQPVHEYAIIYDTPPLYDPGLFHQALTTVCDWIDQNTTSGNGDTIYYLDYQIGQSHNRMAFPPIVVPHLQKDEPPPVPIPDYVPKRGDTAYDIAEHQSEIDEKNMQAHDAWVAREAAIKKMRAEVIANVHEQVERLRRTKPIYDSSASDYIGALQDAAAHFNRFPSASHTIVIASSLVQNTPVNQTNSLSLRGARVVGIYISAPTTPVLQEREQAFLDVVKQAGAGSVELYEPQDSIVLDAQL